MLLLSLNFIVPLCKWELLEYLVSDCISLCSLYFQGPPGPSGLQGVVGAPGPAVSMISFGHP